MLPGGDHLLYTLTKGAGIARWDQAQIVVQSLATGERSVVINGGSDARYVPTGHLVYAVGADLLAVPFDVSSLTVTGGPVPVLERVGRASTGNTGATFFTFSQSGALAYIVGEGLGPITGNRNLALVDRKGVPLRCHFRHRFTELRVSPDGRQMAFVVFAQNEANIWIYDLAGGVAPRRLTFGSSNFSPAWTKDGQRILFISTRDENRPAIFWQAADGSGSAERLTDAKAVQPSSLRPSSDAKHVFYRETRGDDSIWMLPLDGDRKPQRLIEALGNQDHANLSPDGRWIVYQSIETGRTQTYVQPFPPTGARYQITTTSAAYEPLWFEELRQRVPR